MNCPLCGSDIANGAKYCPVCGADVEAAQRRSAGQMSGRIDPTRRMPPMQDQTAPRATAQRPSRAAVPMNSSMPPQYAAPHGGQHAGQQPQNLRNFDTSQMGGTPKWPIVLIVLLALVIVVALVLIIFQPWKAPSQPSGTTNHGATAPVASTQDGTQTSDTTGATTPADPNATQPAADPNAAPAPAGLSNADAYAQLTDLYNQLAGYNDRIGSVAEDFNSMYLSDDLAARQSSLANAQALQGEIAAQQATLNAMTLASDTAYQGSLDTMKTLYNDLANRIRVLVEAWQASVNAGDNPAGASDQISSILGADNGEGGVNRYKAEYDALYPSSAPVAPAA